MSVNLGGDQCAFKCVRFIDINPRRALMMEGFKRKDEARVLESPGDLQPRQSWHSGYFSVWVFYKAPT